MNTVTGNEVVPASHLEQLSFSLHAQVQSRSKLRALMQVPCQVWSPVQVFGMDVVLPAPPSSAAAVIAGLHIMEGAALPPSPTPPHILQKFGKFACTPVNQERPSNLRPWHHAGSSVLTATFLPHNFANAGNLMGIARASA